MRWFFGAIIVLGVSFALRSGLVVFGAVAFTAVWGLSRILTKEGLSKLEAVRRLDTDEVTVGDTISVCVTLSNRGRWPIPWILIEDMLSEAALMVRPSRMRVKGGRIRVRGMKAGSSAEIEYDVQLLGRGFFPIGPMLIESGDVFGLHRRYRVLAPPKFVTVLPRIVPLAGYDIASRRPIGDVKLSHRLYEDPTRTAGVRPYQRGDPLNRIHWRATARTGTLHSRVFEPSCLAGATILLDFHSDGYPARGEPMRSDLAATTVASLANAILEIRQQVGFWSNGADAAERWLTATQSRRRQTALSEEECRTLVQQLRGAAAEDHQANNAAVLGVPTRRGEQQMPRIRQMLARLDISEARPFPEFVAEISPKLPRDATVLVVLPGATERHAIALGQLRRQGYAVAVVLVIPGEDQAIDAMARLAAEGVRDVRLLEDESQLSELCQSQITPARIGLAMK